MTRPGPHHNRRAHGVAQLLEQVARRVLEKRDSNDLHAAQWSALRYFSRAGRRTANVAGLSKYLGNTMAPASRTARSLVDRGLLSACPSPDDARAVIFSLTQAGFDRLEEDPLIEIANLVASLDTVDIATLSESLEALRSHLDDRNVGK